MPPKAKDSSTAAAAPEPGLSSDLMEAELVMAVLRSRLGRYQAAGEKLAVENFSLADELARQKLTLQDINEFLTTELKARSLTAAQLEERVAQLSTRLAEVQKEAQAEIARARAEAAAAVAAAAAGRAAAAGGDGAAGEGCSSDLAGQKAQLERTVAELTATLAARQRDFDAQLSDMERRHLQEKEKMRKEAATKIRETKMAMAQLADQHLESSTKRTLVENETMVAELAYHTAQSHDLVAANSILRSEAAELRRQLAIADKTVKSTAQKNLLLLQTIKSILTCLREEARHNAEEAVAAQQRQQSSTGWQAGPADLSAAAAGRHVLSHLHPAAPQQQQQQQHWQDMQQAGLPLGPHAVLSAAGAAGDAAEQQQQQQECADAVTVQQHLEDRVVQLAHELCAAQQALAAALQDCMPADMQSQCTVDPAHSRPEAAAAAAVEQAHRQAAADSSSSSSSCRGNCASPEHGQGGSGSKSPAGSKLQKPQRPRTQQKQQQEDLKVSRAPGPVEAALQDGVAAFVLFCVQQLRSGSRQQQPCSAGAGAGAAGGLQSSSKTDRAASEPGRAAAAAAAAGAGVARSTSKSTAAAAAGGGVEGRVSPCSSRAHRTLQSQAAALSAGADLCRDTAAAGGLSSSEQLARLLLDQLHSYSRQNLLPYDGLCLSFDTAGPAPDGQQQAVGAQEGAAAGGDACSSEQAIAQWPAVPLPVAGSCMDASRGVGGMPGTAASGGTAAAAAAAAPGVHVAEECGTSLQLPALPCLLNNMGHGKPAVQQPCTATHSSKAAAFPSASAAATSNPKGDSGGGGSVGSARTGNEQGSSGKQSPPKAAKLGLFDAVLSDVGSQWGPGAAAAAAAGPGTGGQAVAHSPPGALSPSSKAARGALSRSRTPTSPAGAKAGRVTPLSSPSGRVKAAVHFD